MLSCSVLILIFAFGLNLKPVCFVLIINIFSFYIRKQKKDTIAHYLAHTKSGSCLRKARVPEYQLHAILMYVFMISFKRMI